MPSDKGDEVKEEGLDGLVGDGQDGLGEQHEQLEMLRQGTATQAVPRLGIERDACGMCGSQALHQNMRKTRVRILC